MVDHWTPSFERVPPSATMRVLYGAGHPSRSHLMKSSLQFGLAVISGLLLVFSFPRFDLAFLAWIALAPLIFVITSEAAAGRLRPLRALTLGWVTGLVFT